MTIQTLRSCVLFIVGWIKKIAENASVCLCSCSDSKQQIELALTIRMYAPWWAKELESKSHLGEFWGWTEFRISTCSSFDDTWLLRFGDSPEKFSECRISLINHHLFWLLWRVVICSHKKCLKYSKTYTTSLSTLYHINYKWTRAASTILIWAVDYILFKIKLNIFTR